MSNGKNTFIHILRHRKGLVPGQSLLYIKQTWGDSIITPGLLGWNACLVGHEQRQKLIAREQNLQEFPITSRNSISRGEMCILSAHQALHVCVHTEVPTELHIQSKQSCTCLENHKICKEEWWFIFPKKSRTSCGSAYFGVQLAAFEQTPAKDGLSTCRQVDSSYPLWFMYYIRKVEIILSWECGGLDEISYL